MTPAPTIDRVGIGLAAVGRPAYITVGRERDLPDRSVDALRTRTWELLDAAYAAGIRYADAARSYGRAEEFLAGWLTDRGHADMAVGSKWGYEYVGDWRLDAELHERKQHTPAMLARQYAESRALLGDRLGLYQVHSATLESGVFDDPALLAALTRLREDGVRVGLSTSGPQQAAAVRRALGLTVDGEPVFGSVQSTWNLLEPSVGPALAEAADAGWAVLVKEAFGNGRLTALGDAGTGGTPLAELAGRLGVGPDAVALRAALDAPWSPTVLTGPATPDQLASNLQALAIPELELSALERLTLEMAEPPADYWRQRSARAWA